MGWSRRPNEMYGKPYYFASITTLIEGKKKREACRFESLESAKTYAEIWSRTCNKVIKVTRQTTSEFMGKVTKYNDCVGSFKKGVYTPYIGPAEKTKRSTLKMIKEGKK